MYYGFYGYNDGLQGLAWYEEQLEIAEDMQERGIEDIDEYYRVIADEKEAAQIAFNEKDR